MTETLECGCERLADPTFSVRSDEWRLGSAYAERCESTLDELVGIAWRETLPVTAFRVDGDELVLELRVQPALVCGERRDHARTFVQRRKVLE